MGRRLGWRAGRRLGGEWEEVRWGVGSGGRLGSRGG